MKKAESRKLFGAKVREIALSATIILLSLFTKKICQEVFKA
jgi:hypothetical protein